MSTHIVNVQAALVIEQDFILQIRRMQKTAEPNAIFNLLLSDIPQLANGVELMHHAHDKLHDFAAKANGEMYAMTNHDVFVVLPESSAAGHEQSVIALLKNLMPAAPVDLAHVGTLIKTFEMPRDYLPLRERVNDYIEIAKEIASNKADDPERNLQADAVQGPLTAYAMSQIERLLDDIDIAKYARGQRIMQRKDGMWALHYEEQYISMTDMARDKFPRLEFTPSSRLMAELGSVLDRRMLAHMLRHEGWQGKKIGFNLSAKTVLSSTFAQFCHVVQGDARHNVTFEINISDLFHDMPTFNDAMAVLRQHGFRVAIEGIHPAMMQFLRLDTLEADDIKIKAYAELLPFLAEPTILQAIRSLPLGKLVMNRVDSKQALDIGTSIGITKFQGFYIDENAKA